MQDKGPAQDLLLELYRLLLEREEIAKFAISEFSNRKVELDCQEYVWTVACTF